VRKVLVVDDDPTVARLAAIALRQADLQCTVDYCSDGAQGRIKAAGGQYDLVVLDLAMPFMGGEEALAEMKRNPKSARTPVVVVTALEDPELHQRVAALGAVTVIPKPFHLWQLVDVVSVLFAGKMPPAPDAGREPGPMSGT
jgi:DNA-binding response OmpR family regulator